jgi:hypothetical protein
MNTSLQIIRLRHPWQEDEGAEDVWLRQWGHLADSLRCNSLPEGGGPGSLNAYASQFQWRVGKAHASDLNRCRSTDAYWHRQRLVPKASHV